jgi:hypothetical protein
MVAIFINLNVNMILSMINLNRTIYYITINKRLINLREQEGETQL